MTPHELCAKTHQIAYSNRTFACGCYGVRCAVLVEMVGGNDLRIVIDRCELSPRINDRRRSTRTANDDG